MTNDEKYIRGYSLTTYKSLGTIAVRLILTDGTYENTNFMVFSKDEKIDFKRLPIIGRSKKDAREMLTLLRKAAAGVII